MCALLVCGYALFSNNTTICIVALAVPLEVLAMFLMLLQKKGGYSVLNIRRNTSKFELCGFQSKHEAFFHQFWCGIRLSQNAPCLVVLEPVPGSAGPVGHPVRLKSIMSTMLPLCFVLAGCARFFQVWQIYPCPMSDGLQLFQSRHMPVPV